MHIFLQGPRNIGKSTVVLKTLDILKSSGVSAVGDSTAVGGFFTWNGGKTDPHVYMRPARIGADNEVYRLASFNTDKGGLVCDTQAFERDGVRLLTESKNADLIIMDELGFLESGAASFRQTVLDSLTWGVPILGVLRLDIPWHMDIKSNPLVTILDVDEKNRGDLPQLIASEMSLSLYPRMSTIEELRLAIDERASGVVGRSASAVADNMESLIAEAETSYNAGKA